MCLSTWSKLKPSKGEKVGYKILSLREKSLSSLTFGGTIYELDKWYRAKKHPIPVLRKGRKHWSFYKSGFHIFLSKRNCKSYLKFLRTLSKFFNVPPCHECPVMVKVRYRFVRYTGRHKAVSDLERRWKVDVASEMMVEKIITEIPE